MKRLALLLLLAGCAEEPIVPLLQVHDVAPRQIELGDELDIEGAAYPQGRKARVLLEGTLSRPGEAASTDEVELEGDVVAPDRIAVRVTDGVLAALCGAGSTAAHTTFSGAVTVVFASQASGGPPVSGRIDLVTLDVLPSVPSPETGAFAASLGLHVEARPAGGLLVTEVDPGSRAAAAGVSANDVILAADGLHVLAPADLLPPPQAASLALALRHPTGAEDTRRVALAAQPDSPRRFAIPALIVCLAALLVVLMSSAPGRWPLWLHRQLGPPVQRSWFAEGVGLLLVGALPVVAPGADVAVLALVVVTGAVALGLTGSHPAESKVWHAAVMTASGLVPAVLALAGALALSGSLRADELTAAQGFMPWGYFALRSPAHLALAVAAVVWVAFRPIPVRQRPLVLGFLGLVVIAFLGGWRLPSVAAHPHGGSGWLAAPVLVGKTGALWVVLTRLRLPAFGFRGYLAVTWGRLLPLAGLAALGAVAWERHVTSRMTSAVTSFLLVVVLVALGGLVAWPRAEVRPRVDPMR